MDFRGDPFHIPVSDDPFYSDRRSDRRFAPHSSDNMFYERPASSFQHHFSRPMPDDYWPSSAFHGRGNADRGWTTERPIKVNFESPRPGRSDAESDASSRCSSSSSGSAYQPKVHHIPIMVEPRDGSAPYMRQPANEQPDINKVDPRETLQREQVSPPKTQATRQSPTRQSPPRAQHIQPESQQSQDTVDGEQQQQQPEPPNRGRRIPIQVERTESSPVIGEMARRRMGKSAGEPPFPDQGFTNTFPRRKVDEAPLGSFKNFFFGGGNNSKQGDSNAPTSPPRNKKSPGREKSPPQKQQRQATPTSTTTSSSRDNEPADNTFNEQISELAAKQQAAIAEKARLAKMTPLEKIADVMSRLKELADQVHRFEGVERNKEFKYLDEMLTRLMLTLDNIDADNDEVRKARRAAVKSVQEIISLLEAKGRPVVELEPRTVIERDGIPPGAKESASTIQVGNGGPMETDADAKSDGLQPQMASAPPTEESSEEPVMTSSASVDIVQPPDTKTNSDEE